MRLWLRKLSVPLLGGARRAGLELHRARPARDRGLRAAAEAGFAHTLAAHLWHLRRRHVLGAEPTPVLSLPRVGDAVQCRPRESRRDPDGSSRSSCHLRRPGAPCDTGTVERAKCQLQEGFCAAVLKTV